MCHPLPATILPGRPDTDSSSWESTSTPSSSTGQSSGNSDGSSPGEEDADADAEDDAEEEEEEDDDGEPVGFVSSEADADADAEADEDADADSEEPAESDGEAEVLSDDDVLGDAVPPSSAKAAGADSRAIGARTAVAAMVITARRSFMGKRPRSLPCATAAGPRRG
ncbi:hypothetical protein [Streptomyces sp. NPDC003401]